MLRNFAIKALFLLVSATLFPAAGVAVEGHDTVHVGRLDDGIDAYVDISYAGGRMSAVPLIKIEEKFENRMLGAAESKEEEAKSVAKILKEEKAKSLAEFIQEGDVSYSNGVKLVNRVKEAVKRRKEEKAGKAEISGNATETSPGGMNFSDKINVSTDGDPREKGDADNCGTCDLRNRILGSVMR